MINNIVMKDALNHSILNKDDVINLITLAQSGDKAAKDILIEHNYKLVAQLAEKYKKIYKDCKLDEDDFFQAGLFGLFKAIDNFQFDQNASFPTYATKCISSYIKKELFNNGFEIRLTNDAIQKITQINKVKKELQKENKEITLENISLITGLDVADIEFYTNATNKIYFSLDAPIIAEESNSGDYSEIISDVNSISQNCFKNYDDADNEIFNEHIRDLIDHLTENFTPSEKEFINLRFGFEDGISKELTLVAKIMNISYLDVKKIENATMRKLRHPRIVNTLKQAIAI